MYVEVNILCVFSQNKVPQKCLRQKMPLLPTRFCSLIHTRWGEETVLLWKDRGVCCLLPLHWNFVPREGFLLFHVTLLYWVHPSVCTRFKISLSEHTDAWSLSLDTRVITQLCPRYFVWFLTTHAEQVYPDAADLSPPPITVAMLPGGDGLRAFTLSIDFLPLAFPTLNLLGHVGPL